MSTLVKSIKVASTVVIITSEFVFGFVGLCLEVFLTLGRGRR